MTLPRLFRRARTVAARLLCLGLACLCLLTTASAAPKFDEVRAQIQAALDQQSACWSKGDLEGYLGFYLDSPELTFAITDKINKGYNDLHSVYERVFNLKNMGKMRYEDTQIYPLCETSALSVSRYTISVDGQPALGGVVTYGWTKTSKGWKIFHDHRTAGAPRVAGGPTTSGDGLVIEDLVVGTGDTAVSGKRVTVNYRGTFTDGRQFDSSYDRGQPFVFQLGGGQVIPGWDKGLVGMKVGGKRKLLIPAKLAYGSRGAGNVIPPNTPLVFEVELLEVK